MLLMARPWAADARCGSGDWRCVTRSPACRSTCGYSSGPIIVSTGSFPGQCLALLRTHTQCLPGPPSRARGQSYPMPLEVAAHGRHEADERARRTGPPENSRFPACPPAGRSAHGRRRRRRHPGARPAGGARRGRPRGVGRLSLLLGRRLLLSRRRLLLLLPPPRPPRSPRPRRPPPGIRRTLRPRRAPSGPADHRSSTSSTSSSTTCTTPGTTRTCPATCSRCRSCSTSSPATGR